jgi:general secretion pathway protein G
MVVIVIAVVGGLVLVAMIGIIAAIAIPNLITAQQRAKQKRTMADIRSIATAAEAYATDNNQYPETVAVVAPKYLKTVPERDGWGHRFEYACLADESGKCTGYVIASPAKDGVMEREAREAVTQSHGPTTNFDCDIVYSNGSFVEYPQGAQ